ncbi:hypothetical protein WJX74_004562 [Apatococcus lobatus]|uniref:Uncharacterized protein n=2 Tax=Apatococcus TaxID=904362 RepID=A0AAW1S026_9CHLO
MEESPSTVVRVPPSKVSESRARENLDADEPQADFKPSKMKVMGILAQAVKRFQASMNPTYTYGKRRHGASQDQRPSVIRKQSSSGGLADPDDNAASRKANKIPGKRTSIIFAPLPPPESINLRLELNQGVILWTDTCLCFGHIMTLHSCPSPSNMLILGPPQRHLS